MNSNLCCLYPAYGAMVKALPQDAAHLNGLTEELIVQAVIPFFKQPQAKPIAEPQFNQWFNNLNGLEGLDDLDGLKKKLKGVAKKVVTAHKKVIKSHKKVFKKLEKNKFVKKIARPLAYAVGAATGTIGFVAQADQARNKMRQGRVKAQQVSEQEPIYQEPTPDAVDFNQGFAPSDNSFMPNSFMPSQPPGYSTIPPIARAAPVTRLEQPDNDGQIVGVNGGAIMENIKANPLPWAVGAGVLALLVLRK